MNDNRNRHNPIRQEQVLEAEILENDTLTKIALRHNCSPADIKRLNKIEKDNEIFAFKVLKVPLTPHNILLDIHPKVHKSGNSSPQANGNVATASTHNELPNTEKLEEKLLVASVTNATITKSNTNDTSEVINDDNNQLQFNEPLLEKPFRGYPRAIKPPNDFLQFNGSDCELNWIFLLIAILALCVIIPLIYVFLIYEHPEKFHSGHSKYDDPDLHIIHHPNHLINSTG